MTEPIEDVRHSPAPALGGNLAPGVLPRRLGVFALTFLIIAWNAPIAAMAGFQQLAIGFGNGIGSPVAFLVAGAILLLFAVGFIGMTKYVKNPGAFYCYIVDGLGRVPGLGGAFVATAAYIFFAAGSYVFLGLITVDMTATLFGDPIGSWQLWSLIAVAIITLLGLLRIDVSMRVIGTLVVLEILLVAAWELSVLVQGGPEGYSTKSFTFDSFTSGTVGLGVLFAMLCMIGFEGGACFRDETVNPDKNVRRATFAAIAFMTLFYAVGNWVYIITQGPSKAVDSALNDPIGSFYASIETYLGNVVLDVVVVVLVTSQMAANISIQGNGSRYLFALGRDGVLTRRLAKVHPRLESPHVAVLTFSAISLAILIGVIVSDLDPVQSYAALTGMGIYFILPLLMATSVAVIVYFRRHPEHNAGLWVGVVSPLVAVATLVVLFVLVTKNMTILTITDTGALLAEVGLAVVALLGCALALYYRKKQPEVYEKIGNV